MPAMIPAPSGAVALGRGPSKENVTRGVEFGVTRRYRAIDEEMSAVAPQIRAEAVRLDVGRLRQTVEGEIGVGIV